MPGRRCRHGPSHPQKPHLAVLQPGLEGFESHYRLPFIVGGCFLATGASTSLLLHQFA